jgi:hypothetical protein
MTLLLALGLGFLAGLVYARAKILSFLLLVIALLLAGGFINIDW